MMAFLPDFKQFKTFLLEKHQNSGGFGVIGKMGKIGYRWDGKWKKKERRKRGGRAEEGFSIFKLGRFLKKMVCLLVVIRAISQYFKID